MTEDEKMKMRYLREQKEHARESLLGDDRHLGVNMSRKRNKFNLASDDDSDD
jgi:nucleolar protein 14